MGLQSKLFRGDAKLEAAAVSHQAHIMPNSAGEHVRKIQEALIAVDKVQIDAAELAAGRYGPSTAGAVLSYKKRRNIVNRTYQTQADNIVGIMTITALDKEMFEQERAAPVYVGTINCRWTKPRDTVAGKMSRGGKDA